METCFNYADGKIAYFSSDERRWINKVHRLKEGYPDLVRIIAEPEQNDGCIYCQLPAEWLHVRPPKKMNWTEEQIEANRERMRLLRKSTLSVQK